MSTDDLIVDWRKRWSRDCYSFVFGMIFALIICILKQMNLIDDYENNLDQYEDDNLEFREKRREKYALSAPKKLFLVLISIISLFSYFLFSILCISKENCDAYTPYITIIPVYLFSKFLINFL